MKVTYVMDTLSDSEGNRGSDVFYPHGEESGLHYGFMSKHAAASDRLLQIPELNSGFITSADSSSQMPDSFKCDVPCEGIYRVDVTVKAESRTQNALIFIGRRRLALNRAMEEGETYTGAFLTHICPVIPRGSSQRMEDTSLDITVVPGGLKLISVSYEPANDRRLIYIAGDSTVTDQSAECPYHPKHSYSGWGQMLSCFVSSESDDKFHAAVAVSNHAHSGLTTVSMRSEGHYGIISERIRPGDICLFQFGHNDQKLSELKAHEGYREKLSEYVDEMLALGAVPVIISPLARNTWKSSEEYNDLLWEYAEECRILAGERNIPFIDLHGFAMELICRMGREAVKCYFYPSDYTHTNDYGAFLFAGYVASELRRLGVIDTELCMGEWTPEAEMLMKPDCGLSEKDDKAKPDTSADVPEKRVITVDRPDDMLTRAEAFTMVTSVMKFFPTNVYNDMFEDVVGHETFAGSIQCAYQNGYIPESMLSSSRLEPDREITAGEFFEILRLGYACRRSDAGAIEELRKMALHDGEPVSRALAAAICSEIRI